MLFQAACLARFGNALFLPSRRPFIISAIYIDSSLTAKWHLVYQPRVLTAPYLKNDGKGAVFTREWTSGEDRSE
jgi:hypothetical protein